MAIDCHIKFDGVSGESQHDKHKDEVDVLSFSFGLSNPASMTGAGSLSAGKAEPHVFQFVHKYDKASPVLKSKCVKGEQFKTVVLTTSKAGDGQQTFHTVTMKGVFITDIRIQATGGGEIAETVSLAYSDIEVEYKPFDKENKPGGGAKFGWDVTATKHR